MRFVVYGLGAIGGVVAGALARSGAEVVGIARGAMLEALRQGPLRLSEAGGDARIPLDCVDAPERVGFRERDCILLCMKGQDTMPALQALRAAGVDRQPIFCCQNGVANERAALRLFPNVHGITVMMPATYVAAGHVACFSAPQLGMFDIGRYPHGADADDAALAAALTAANIAAYVQDDVMASKYGKLLMNLTNIVEAAVGRERRHGRLSEDLRAEGRAVLTAAGIAFRDIGAKDPRRDRHMHDVALDGVASRGSSTSQSLARATGSIETDYLNGEISLLGRLHDVPTPLNDAATRLAARLVASGAPPGSMTLAELTARLTARGHAVP